MIVGTVHSGVALAMARAARESGTLMIVPNAGADEVTGPMCAPNIFRSSFSNWQTGYAPGVIAAQKGYKRAMTITWNYAAGNQMVKGFTEAFEKGGGKVIKELNLPFPNVEFQALLTEIAAQKPDVVFAFFAGGGAVKFVKDYDAAGLKKSIPLIGAGFLTDGTLQGQGESAQGLITALHYGDNLDTPRNNAFRNKFAVTYKLNPDVYAVQGYDAAQLLAGRGPERRQGRRDEEGRDDRGDEAGQDRQPARAVHDEPAAQPGAGHVRARGQGKLQRRQRRGRQGARRPGPRLQDVSAA